MCQGSPKASQVCWWFTKDDPQNSAHRCTHSCDLWQQKQTQHNQQKEKVQRHGPGQIKGRPRESCPGGAAHNARDACVQPARKGKLFRLGARTGSWSPCLWCTKVPDIQRKARVQHKSHCLYEEFRHSEPFSTGMARSLPKSKFPDTKGNLDTQPLNRQWSSGCYANSFLYTV